MMIETIITEDVAMIRVTAFALICLTLGQLIAADLVTPETTVRELLSRPAPANWQPSKVDRNLYLDLAERICRNAAPWVDERGAVIDPVIHKEWQQTTPRFVATGAILLYFGRCEDLREVIFRAMDYVCRALNEPGIKDRSSDFWMREIATAYRVLQKVAPPERVAEWQKQISQMVPEQTYLFTSPDPAKRAEFHNWAVYASAGESLRQSAGIGGPDNALWGDKFFDEYMSYQLKKFNDFGMYRDPNDPITYDITTRLQIAAALEQGYSGKLRPELESLLKRGDFVTLLEVAPTGEVPFGGRSSQFYFQEGIVSALCELAASHYKDSDPRLAGAFKRQAHLSAMATKDGLLRSDGKLFHLKNRFTPETRHGCDLYGHYSVYSLFAGSVLGLAALYADDTIAEAPAPAEIGHFGFAVTGSFEKAFANANDNYLEFDLLPMPLHDACGLGRILLAGLPWGVLPVLPFAAEPHYVIAPDLPPNKFAAAVAPEWRNAKGEVERLAEKTGAPAGVFRTVDAQAGIFEAVYEHRGATVTYLAKLTAPGKLELTVTVSGDSADESMLLPILQFDGQNRPETQILPDGLAVTLNHTMLAITGGAPQPDGTAVNRTGLYQLYRFPMTGKTITLKFAVNQK